MVAAKARKLKLKKYPMLKEGRVYFLMKIESNFSDKAINSDKPSESSRSKKAPYGLPQGAYPNLYSGRDLNPYSLMAIGF